MNASDDGDDDDDDDNEYGNADDARLPLVFQAQKYTATTTLLEPSPTQPSSTVFVASCRVTSP